MLKRALIFLCFMITACGNQVTSAPVSISTSTNTPSLGDHFPQYINTPNVYYDFAVVGRLVIEDGCLRLVGIEGMYAGDNFLLIWGPQFSTRTEQGTVQVVNENTGEVLAKAGDFVEIGYGGTKADPTEVGLREAIPDECSGPYVLVGYTVKKIDRPSLGAYFPQLVNRQSTSDSTVITGKLVLDNGCLRLSDVAGAENGDSFLLVWNRSHSTFAEQGVVQVINSDTGNVLARVGDLAKISGGFIEDPAKWGLIESLPSGCVGPYFLVGLGSAAINKIDKP